MCPKIEMLQEHVIFRNRNTVLAFFYCLGTNVYLLFNEKQFKHKRVCSKTSNTNFLNKHKLITDAMDY